MNENSSINEKIDVLNNLNNRISELDKFLSPLLEKDYENIMKEISPKERVDMNWSLSYTTYSLYYLLLKINNHDPNQHQVKDEMKRIESLYAKIKEIDKTPLPTSMIDKEASARMIKNSLDTTNLPNLTEEGSNKRKLKGNVALPELTHLNVNKFKQI